MIFLGATIDFFRTTQILIGMRRSTTYHSSNGYIVRGQVKKHFGWTDALIEKYLSPKKTELNKHGTTTQFYSVDSVKGAMLGKDFREDYREAQRRRQRASKAVQTKVLNAMDRTLELEITLPDLTQHQLYAKGIEWGKSLLKDEAVQPSLEDGPDVLNAIAVGYLLNQQRSHPWSDLSKKNLIGKREVEYFHFLLVLDSIAKKFPFLEGECDERSGHNLNLLIDQAYNEVMQKRGEEGGQD
jgi:hypothetical protein